VAASDPAVPAPVPAPPDRPPPLAADVVHLWHADLDDDAAAAGAAPLAADERARAERMAPTPRRRFERSRGLLRTILGGYLERDPAALRFALRGEGKPELADPSSPPIRFNLSHAAGRWLLAVSYLEVGVDVERTDRPVDVERVARRVLRPAEASTILDLRGDERRRAFFRAWTGREALVKARGEGMFTLSLAAEMDVRPDRGPRLTGDAAAEWTLIAVPAVGDACAALAARGRVTRVEAFRVGEEAS